MRRFLCLVAAIIAFAGCSGVATGYSEAWGGAQAQASDPKTQVLFVCQHGNVKSVMAASYFNQQAEKLGLPYRAGARGVAPDSPAVPPSIAEGLRADGLDVKGFHAEAVKASDTAASQRVITIGATLPAESQKAAGGRLVQWNDVPPASDGFAGTRDAIKAHVRRLIEELNQR
jgi:arsenate reductase